MQIKKKGYANIAVEVFYAIRTSFPSTFFLNISNSPYINFINIRVLSLNAEQLERYIVTLTRISTVPRMKNGFFVCKYMKNKLFNKKVITQSK
jgi:hypothetical protein